MKNYSCYKCEESGKTCSECKENAEKRERLAPVVKAFVASIEAPPGFVKTTGRGFHNGFEKYDELNKTWVLLENAEAGIKIAINVDDLPRARYQAGKKVPCRFTLEDVSCSGHTCYKSEAGHWLSFDRRGVEDSFYLGDYGTPLAEFSKVFQEQLIRIEKSKETSKKMLKIPGFGFSVHQDQLEELKKKLRSGGSHTFTPAGFGTGHIVSTRRGRYGTKLPAETAKFFGVPELYDETFDHD
jgi:hypothetical protein